jgi:hypothetical protein
MKEGYLGAIMNSLAVSSALEATARRSALRNVVSTRIEAERYKIEHGRWPDTIQVLRERGARVEDPFSGAPLVFDQGPPLRISSIGENRADDGGAIVAEIADDQ